MPLFISDEEYQRCANDSAQLVEKADAFIRDLYVKLDTVKAQNEAASVTAEQTCSLLEQKYVSLSADYARLESDNAQLTASVEKRLSELAQVQAEKHQLHLASIGKDGEFERLMAEASEHQKSKRQMMELLEQKELEISEKNSTIKAYLDKIVSLTENAAVRENKLSEIETELQRSKAACSRLSQEKELIERHNVWLNDELTAKVNNLIELRSAHSELETEMSTKISDVERQFAESSNSLKWYKDRVKELESKVGSLEEDLCALTSSASSNEERFSAEITTVNKLVELYKERSEEWAKKAGELEGVIQALEIHLGQVEKDNKEKIEKEISGRKELEKEAENLREKLAKCEADIEAGRKTNEQTLQLSDFTTEMRVSSFEISNDAEETQMLVPKVPVGISGTALAATLLREGWSLTKMYCKYQEAVDALRHEQLGRKHAEELLKRILSEVEAKAEAILDERAEHEKVLDAYSVINDRLQHSLSEKANLETTIQGLQAEMKRKERDYIGAQKDIADLQKQVTLLLKECRDVQLRCGLDDSSSIDGEVNGGQEAETIICEQRLTFKDINGLVEQNVQLRSLVRKLSEEVENRDIELKEKFEMEIKKHTDEAASKIAIVLERAEEQAQMIESLHTSVAMYKKLYEEEQKWRSSFQSSATAPEGGANEVVALLDDSHTDSRKAKEQSDIRAKLLEDELSKTRSELLSIKNDRDKLMLEANFARERLENFLKEFEHQRVESNGILARNIEFSQIIIDYQRKLRESSDALHAAEDLSRKLTMEVSILKHEKEMLSNAERRACDEVRSLSERVYRFQASLDTIHSAEEVREEARILEIKKQEEHVKNIEREWAEAKKELQDERENAKALAVGRNEIVKNAMRQVEEIGKELAHALQAVAAAESRAAVAETQYLESEKRLKSVENKMLGGSRSDGLATYSFEMPNVDTAKEEVQKLKEEVRAAKDHMLQYKSIAQVNETALKQMEVAHEEYKTEAEKLKSSLEAEISSLRAKISELESESVFNSKQVASASFGKEEAIESAAAEISNLKNECSAKLFEIEELKVRISTLDADLEREHQRWVTAQANYERQVILQSETIQELTKTSKALSLLQEETSNLRRVSDALKSENMEYKRKWEDERSMLEDLKNEAEKKYNEINEQNKILHSHLEALHIQLAERDKSTSRLTAESSGSDLGDSGMQTVVSYLRRSKEIAETEIALLKQERLRLQSQLESAMKSAEAARASLHAERSSSRAQLFTEDEIKSLQLQVREMNLLRESNMQLREENKHNFEECQKLREAAQKNKSDMERLESLLMEKVKEIEAFRKESEIYKTEKDLLEKRVTELLQSCQNIDVMEYNCMKDEFKQMQVKLSEKVMQLEEIDRLVGEKQSLVSTLERDVSEREKKISELEVSLKSELDRNRKFSLILKRRVEKETEELSRSNAALQKQLNELKQGKVPMGDVTLEQATKEKGEKETRIQTLESQLARSREEVNKRKEENRLQKMKQTQFEKEKGKFVDEFEKHKQALKSLLLDVERAKQTKDLSLEGNASLQLLTGSALDENAASFLGTSEDIEKIAQLVVLNPKDPMTTTSAAPASVLPPSGPAVPVQTPSVVPPLPSSTQPFIKTNTEKERRPILSKTGTEARRPPRRLVRPKLFKPEEPQGDVEMHEVEGTSSQVIQAPASDKETRNISMPVEQTVRKRQATSLSESLEGSVLQGGTGNLDDALPASKKPKSSEPSVQSPGESPANLESDEALPAVEEPFEAVGDLTQDMIDEVLDSLKDDDVQAVEEEPKEYFQHEGTSQIEIPHESDNIPEDTTDKQDEIDSIADDVLKDEANAETQPLIESEKEEGELDPDVADPDGGSEMYNQASPELGEGQTETVENVTPPTMEAMDEALNATLEADDDNIPEAEEKNIESHAGDETAKGLDKSNIGNDNEQVATEITEGSMAGLETLLGETNEKESTAGGAETIPKAASSSTSEREESKQASSTVINLNEKAKEKARERQAGMISTSAPRGAGRGTLRGRAGRRLVRGRGQPPPGDRS